MILCDIEFAPGTFSFQGATAQANYRIRHAGRMVAHGRMTVRRGRITKQAIRRLRPGRYTVAITTGHGRHKRMLWKRTLRVA